MNGLRAALLLVAAWLTVSPARADLTAPGKTTATPAAPATIEYSKGSDGQIAATHYEAGARLTLVAGGQAVRVVARRGERDYVVADSAGHERPARFLELTPFTFVVDGRAVSVHFGDDFKIHVDVAGGGTLVLDPAGQGYLSRSGGNLSAELLAHGAPVPLVKVGSRPDACSDYWDVYVSVVDGVPRKALTLDGLADPPSLAEPTAKLGRDGSAVVTLRTSADEGATRVKRTRYRFDGQVYQAVGAKAVQTR